VAYQLAFLSWAGAIEADLWRFQLRAEKRPPGCGPGRTRKPA